MGTINGSFSFVLLHRMGWSFGNLIKPFKGLLGARKGQEGPGRARKGREARKGQGPFKGPL